ncbi:MAG: helix-turn-helix domain-containing protein [Clostridia bacterium]|nr:helix-turn-helix domain-containing protein [Clostridia bacterium]
MTDFRYLNVPDITGYGVRFYRENKEDTTIAKSWTPHLHDALEVYILTEGDVSFAVESSHYKLQPGDVIITKPNEIHNCVLNSDSVHRHMCFWFDVSASFIFEDFLKHELGKDNLLRPDEENRLILNRLCDRLMEASDAKDTHAQLYLTLEMLDVLRKFIGKEIKTVAPTDTMKQILADINENFRYIKGLDYFCAKYYLSQSTLNRLFKAHLQTTPKMYLETKKLAYSRILLKNGKSVLEASAESGFSDSSNFIRLFKKRFGITPKQYK